MARTWLSMAVAVVLAGASLALFVGRHYVEGADHGIMPGASTWKVTLMASGKLTANEMSVTTLLPPDFRHQHIFDEHFQSKDLMTPRSRRDTTRAEAVWRRADPMVAPPFRITYSFRCVLGIRKPTAAMTHLTRQLDAPPEEGAELKPTPRIESDHADIFAMARQLSGDEPSEVDQVQAYFRFVDRLDNEPSLGLAVSALTCLRNESGDSGGKSRLLAALCRNRGIPARILGGLVLAGDQEQGVHHWVEAWVNNRWLPMCPTFHHFDTRKFPHNYFVMHIGDEEIVRRKGAPVQYGFVVESARSSSMPDDENATTFQRLWHTLSFTGLRPAEQHLIKFLLLLPLASLIVSVWRIMIGIPTFGTFGPALLGLAFLDPQALRWGLVIFVAIVLVGWVMRHVIERFHLLLVPRMAILLSLIVLLLIVMVSFASHHGLAVTQFVALFPLVILTHLVERFWTVEAEDGTAASFKTLLGTVIVVVSVSLLLRADAVTTWMFHHPETLGMVLAAQFLLGRYTGYRLSELYRFQDLMHEPPMPGRTT